MSWGSFWPLPSSSSGLRRLGTHAGVTDRVTFLTQDLFATDVSATTVVAIYAICR